MSPPESDDLAFVRSLLADDPHAWRRFAGRELQFIEWVCTQTRERTGHSFSAHDIADDVSRAMFKLLERDRRLLRRFDARSRLSTYVGVVARTSTLERIRAERGRKLPAAQAEQTVPSPLDGLVIEETRDRVRAAMEGLPEPQRRVLEGFYMKGLTYELVAQELGMTHQDVKRLVASARIRLADLLGKSKSGQAGGLPSAYS